MGKQTTLAELAAWRKQEIESAVRWAEMRVKDQPILEAYKAGFEAGWEKLRAALTLHGIIECKKFS